MRKFSKILVPVDHTPLSEQAIEVGLTLARTYGATLVVLSIHDEAAGVDNDTVRTVLADVDLRQRVLLQRVEAVLAGDAPPPGGYLAEVRSGPVEMVIIEATKDLDAELVVMGTHGRQGLMDQLQGSTAERVAAAVNASVLILKPVGFPFLRE